MNVKRAWTQMDNERRALIARCEKYAAYTLPILCPPEGYNEKQQELQTDYQSVGAQGLNNLTNKLMLALFAPSRPFFRLDIPEAVMQQLQASTGFDPTQFQSAMAVGEKNAIRRLDQKAARPDLYLALKHMIVTGNCLMVLKDSIRAVGIKRFVVKRSQSGRVVRLIVREDVLFDELSDAAQAQLLTRSSKFHAYRANPDSKAPAVVHYTDIRYIGGAYLETQHVDEYRLQGREFEGKYDDHTLPYRALTWELHDDNDYGTGLVEQAAGDFAALSALSQAEVEAAVLASQFRWLVNPSGMTKPEDLQASENGAALPGVDGDIVPLVTGTAASLQHLGAANAKYVQRLANLFLLGSAVVRDAERVTAEEIRMQANELETSLGGVYSRLAVDLQLPIAYWLLRDIKVNLKGTQLQPTIITGLDALSRNGDLDNLKLCLMDLAATGAMPPQVMAVLKMDAVAHEIFTGRGVDPTRYIKSPEEQQQDLENEQAAQLAQQVARPVASAVAGNVTQ